jgi:hypothetical protein
MEISWLALADNLTVSFREIIRLFCWHFVMNASKTKAMKINGKIKTKLDVNGNIIEETENF